MDGRLEYEAAIHIAQLKKKLADAKEQYHDILSEYNNLSQNHSRAMDRMHEVEAERNALAAHVERVKDWWGDERRIRVDMREIEAIVASSPETSLARLKAQWQAEVLIEFGYLFGPESTVRMMTQREADKLRRQAQEPVHES